MALNQKDRETCLQITVGESPFPGRRSISLWSKDGSNEVVKVVPKKTRTFLIPLPVSAITIADHRRNAPPTKPQGINFAINVTTDKVFVNDAPLYPQHKFTLPHGVAGRPLTFEVVLARRARS